MILNHDPATRFGLKGYDWPDPERLPRFRSGSPQILSQKSFGDIAELCRMSGVQVVLSVGFDASYFRPRAALQKHGIRWVALQHASDMFAVPPDRAEFPDAFCVYANEWARQAMELYGTHHTSLSTASFAATGAPSLDPLREIRPDTVREKFGIPRDSRVVVWLPHDTHPADAWETLIYRGNLHPKALARLWRSDARRMVGALFRQPLLPRLFAAVKGFCERSGAVLVTKSRIKDRPAPIERQLADIFTYDRDLYPPTILELLSVADLCVHFFSHVSLEAAAVGIPSLSLAPPPHSDFMRPGRLTWWRVAGDLGRSNGVWNFAGVNYLWPVEEAVDAFATRTLADFVISGPDRQTYLDRFVGPVDGENSERVLEVARGLA